MNPMPQQNKIRGTRSILAPLRLSIPSRVLQRQGALDQRDHSPCQSCHPSEADDRHQNQEQNNYPRQAQTSGSYFASIFRRRRNSRIQSIAPEAGLAPRQTSCAFSSSKLSSHFLLFTPV